MINWWRSETIQMSTRMWKPGLVPLRSEVINNHSWFKSDTQHFSDINETYDPKLNKSKDLIRSRKIKLNPDKVQQVELQKMWDAYRFTYNKTIEAIIDDVINPEDNTFRLLCEVKSDSTDVALDLGCELEPNRNIKVKLNVDFKDPLVTTKIFVKKNQTISFKIKIKHDPMLHPVTMKLCFEYPPPRHWHSYRNEIVTGAAVRGQTWFPNNFRILETNKFIRQGAVQQSVSAYKTIMGNAKNNGTKGSLRTLFQKKKNESWSMNLDRFCIKKTTVTITTIGRDKKPRATPKVLDAVSLCPKTIKNPIKCWEKIGDLEHDPKIHKDKWGDFWLIVPFTVIPKVNNVEKPAASIDCGEKTMLTCYTTDGKIINHGTGIRDDWLTIMGKLHGLQSMLDKNLFHGKTRRYVKDKIEKLWKRLVNMKNDMHWKMANHLTDNYNLIVRGKFNVKGILQGAINKRVKEVLQQQGHYQFKLRLMSKAEEKNVQVKEWSEWGTTIGCPCCGHRTPTSGRTFTCSHCHYTADRDAKAACCIMLKYLAGIW